MLYVNLTKIILETEVELYQSISVSFLFYVYIAVTMMVSIASLLYYSGSIYL